MSFSTAPPEMVDKILNQSGIPLLERIAIRAVSPRFRDILEDGLGQETSLAIHVIGTEEVDPKPDHLVFDIARFTTKKCIQFLGRLFQGVTDLTLYTSSLMALRSVPQLLAPLSGQLQSLKLEGDVTRKSKVDVIEPLAMAINSLVSLTSLHLDVDNLGCKLLPHLTPTLARLEEFSYVDEKSKPPEYRGRRGGPSIDHDKLISGSLSPHCTHLRLGAGRDFDYLNSVFLGQLVSTLTHLQLVDCQMGHLKFVSQLHCLSNLTVHFVGFERLDSALLQQFRPLTQLTELNLIGLFYCSLHETPRALEFPASKEMTIPSIKRLTVDFSPFSFPIDNFINYYYFNDYNDDSFNGSPFLQALPGWFPGMSNFSLRCPRRFRRAVENNLEGLSYTVQLRHEEFTTKSAFW